MAGSSAISLRGVARLLISWLGSFGCDCGSNVEGVGFSTSGSRITRVGEDNGDRLGRGIGSSGSCVPLRFRDGSFDNGISSSSSPFGSGDCRSAIKGRWDPLGSKRGRASRLTGSLMVGFG